MKTVLRIFANLLIGFILFVGLPLFGWGIFDIEGFLGNPARLVYVVSFLVLQTIIVLLIPDVGKNRGAGNQTVKRQQIALLLLQIIPLAIVILAPFTDHREWGVFRHDEAIRFIGIGLYVIGFVGMHWAEATLGKQFSTQVTLQEDHQLITSGPYRILRHPRYLGILFYMCGIALVFRSWFALILVVMLMLVLLWRIHDEELLMQQEFGADWTQYAGKSWRLIPFVY